ncbi:MAG: AI-2E family transporter [Atopobiaceae bacterium]|nr:AI-2E family transporter [Atopobiaceae bacterium]
MRKFKLSSYTTLALAGVLICLIFKGWESIFSFLGILFTAVIPLFLGLAIAYVVSIPTDFLQRHFFPNSKSDFVNAIRKPVCLIITVIIVLAILVYSTSVLIPALIEIVTVVQEHGQEFIEKTIAHPFFAPVREPIHKFIMSDFMQSVRKMDIGGIVDTVFGGSVSNVTNHVLTVATTVMTGFFGVLFSIILLTDTTNAGQKLMSTISVYVGQRNTEKFALVMGVADASFHNFIVRQCIEASILGTTGTMVLLVCGFNYALGVGVLMFLLALLPIVGYPIGLFLGAFMVAIFNPWWALAYLAFVALAQVLEATFVLPYVGDPRTALPPVWVTVGVTIGGGVAGFLGMLMAIPITATIRQLAIIGANRRRNAASANGDANESSHIGEAELAQGLKEDDGDGVGEIE